jgi:hypothetical protein
LVKLSWAKADCRAEAAWPACWPKLERWPEEDAPEPEACFWADPEEPVQPEEDLEPEESDLVALEPDWPAVPLELEDPDLDPLEEPVQPPDDLDELELEEDEPELDLDPLEEPDQPPDDLEELELDLDPPELLAAKDSP